VGNKAMVSEQKFMQEESITYPLERGPINQTSDQWTHIQKARINDLHSIKAFKKTKW
jgi:hypothetical protein